MPRRIEQLNALLQEEIGAIIARDIEFPRGAMATLVAVRTAGDLMSARVTVSIFPDQSRGTILHLLQKHTRRIERILRERLPIHHIPSLSWTADITEEKAAEVETILDSLKEKP